MISERAAVAAAAAIFRSLHGEKARSLSSQRGGKAAIAAGFVALVVGTAGCSYLHTLGSGTHMDSTAPVRSAPDTRVRTIVLEVTTDTRGALTSINVKHSSGKEGTDAYVADSIRQTWPAIPSTRTVVQVSESDAKGFFDKKVLSSTPIP